MAKAKQSKQAAPPDRVPSDTVMLAGSPRSVRGTIRLTNSGMDSLVVRDAQARGDGLPQIAVAMGAIVAPGQTQQVPLSLSLPLDTPPGEYAGELEMAGMVRPLALHVAETVRLRLSPAQLVMDARDGGEVIKNIVLANDGNVPVRIGEIGDVRLGKEDGPRPGIRAVLAAVGVQSVALVGDADPEESAPRLTVRSVSGEFTLAPGEMRSVEFAVGIPANLEPNTSYRGRAALSNASLEFVIPA